MRKLFTIPGLKKKWNAAGMSRLPMLAFAMFLLAASTASAQLIYVTVPPSSNTSSNNMRGPMTSANFHRSAALYRTAEMNGISAGLDLKSLGFSLDTATTSPVSGSIKVYLANTTDATFQRSTTWSTLISAPTAMTLVYDDTLTIPANAGFYDIVFSTPFAYTGGGVYMAFEWTTTSPATTSAWYKAENSLASGVASAASANALPPTLALGSFRPFIRFSYTPMANDITVRAVKALGKVPVHSGTTPTEVKAIVINTGASAANNITVTLNATGGNTHTETSTIATLGSGDTTTVTFTGFSPTATGPTSLTATVPNDDLNTNNSASWTLAVTDTTISHIPPGTQPTSSVGYNQGAGLLLNRYQVTNGQQLYIPRVRVQIGNNAAAQGKTVFAVVLDANGTLLARSADKVLTGGDIGTMVTFPIVDADQTAVTDTYFYVGLAQTAGGAGNGYFPVGTSPEVFPTSGAFYIAPGAAALGGGVVPSENNTLGRFMMEADLTTVLFVGIEPIVSEGRLSVYPNPNSGKFSVSFGQMLNERATIALVDVTGKTVYSNQTELNSDKTDLNVANIPAGLYILQVKTATKVITQQVVID